MRTILAVNAGSSSLKLGLFDAQADTARRISAHISRIGSETSRFVVRGPDDDIEVDEEHRVQDHDAAFELAIDTVAALREVDAVGHRIVRGGVRHRRQVIITSELIDELRSGAQLDPHHLPPTLALVARAGAMRARVPQVACFDTSFHRTMPRVAQFYGLPRTLYDEGVVRLGFHGLSCEHIIDRLTTLDRGATLGRVIVAHLGSGASVTAIRDGASVDTTMGFSPTGGLMMSSRSGDLDPTVLLYLLEQKGLDANAMRALVNLQSGLLGVSGLSADMRELLEQESTMPAAADAVALFCYTARKYLGAMAATLGGLDTLVFTGGIGEHAAPVRERVCEGLAFLGIELDAARNARHEPVISTEQGRVVVRVMPTDEERTIARQVRALLQENGGSDVSV